MLFPKVSVITVISALALAAPAFAQHPPAPNGPTASLQGPPGPFAADGPMKKGYEIMRDAHNQGDKVDLEAFETKIRALAAEMAGGKASREMEDHVLGVAHQALALGVSNPKMFASYEAFMATMMGPQ
jgi:hypothetical protein